MTTLFQEILIPSAAGRFYPANAHELRADIQRYLDEAHCEPSTQSIMAVLVPHAGYVFSAPVAGYSFRHASQQKPDTVLFVALSHQGAQGGCVFTGKGMKTPLGIVETDQELTSALLDVGEPFYSDNTPYHGEHSVEVNLPFVQEVFPHAKIASVLTSQMDQKTCRRIGAGIAQVIQQFPHKKILICISSDMSHYPAYQAANRIDQEALRVLETVDPQAYFDAIKQLEREPVTNLHCVMCGCSAVLSVLEAAKALGVNHAKTLHYRNSGDCEYGDHDKVVGYGSAAWYYPTQDQLLSEKDQRELLQIARQSIEANLNRETFKPLPNNKNLNAMRGMFVTLKHKGELRGCLGRFDADGLPLDQLTAQLAAETAVHDNRFSPLTLKELPDTSISISVLSPEKKVNGPDEIVIGKHGIKIVRDMQNGTLLPQVAAERNWNAVEFLEYTCMKANLPQDAWKEQGTEIYVYEADVFSDTDFSEPPYTIS